MKECPSFLDENSPDGVRVYQMCPDHEETQLVYPDRPSFLSDGRSLVMQGDDGPMICYLDDDCTTRPLSEMPEDIINMQLCMSPCGRYIVYARKSGPDEKVLSLYRLDLETFETELVFEADGTLPGTSVPVSDFRPDTLSAGGRRIAGFVYLGDGTQKNAPFGLVVVDADSGEASVPLEAGNDWVYHLRYCRSLEEEASHDLMFQMNHGSEFDEEGNRVRNLGPPEEGGIDVHVVRDDGTNWRDMPWGRDGKESCIGHQIWRGRQRSGLTVTLQNKDTSYGWADGTRQNIVAGWPLEASQDEPDIGRLNPEAIRAVLSSHLTESRFCHLHCDKTGLKIVCDTFPVFDGNRTGMQVYIAGAPSHTAPMEFRYILNTGLIFGPRSSGMHAHPIVSPDGKEIFFNSNFLGSRQAYMVTGVPWPE